MFQQPKLSKLKILFLSCLIMCVVLAVQFSLIYGLYPIRFQGAKQTQNLTIVLDAGHGGVDGGVVGNDSGTKESDLNLKMCKQLKKQLEDRGVKVVLTRKDSNGLYGMATRGFKLRDMNKRKEIIQQASPDIVVSIHMNKYSDRRRKGPQVFFQYKDSTSQILASHIQAALNNFTGNSHSPLSGDFFICQCVDKPSVIVECGFLSNAEEEILLCDKNYRDRLATQITNGIFLYLYSI